MKYKTTLIAAAVMLTCQTVHAQSAQEVAAEMRQMREELRQLRSELDGLKKQNTQTPSATAAVATQTPDPVSTETRASSQGTEHASYSSAKTSREVEPATNAVNLFGYAELNFSRLKTTLQAPRLPRAAQSWGLVTGSVTEPDLPLN